MESSPEIKDFQKIIKNCLNGKIDAQKELYGIFASRMFGVCLRYSKNHHNAEDLLQEGFVKVFNNLNKFRGDGSFEGWMRRIFVNTAIEHYRKNHPMYPVTEVKDQHTEFINNSAVDSLAADDVLQMVNTLSTGYRTIFNLYAIEGFTHKEIGEMLGISEGTSKSQLARARNLLQKMITESQKVNYEAVSK